MQPHSPETKSKRQADLAACRALLRDGSHTFYVASFLLPRSVREPASALYAFCRLADDSVDVEGKKLTAIRMLRERLDLAYAGKPSAHPVDRAFAHTIERFGIPRDLPEGLIAGLEWDAVGRRYDNLADLQAYAVRVAGTVGAMMAMLMHASSPEHVARACDLGIAMQLTNIARDVGEDARAGRLYLPLSWLHEAGIDADEWLAKPLFSEKLGEVISRLLDTADEFYKRAGPAILKLPFACRPGIRSAQLLYAEIGNELRRRSCDSVSRRTTVSTARKLELCGASFSALIPAFGEISDGCIHEAQFVIDAMTPTHGAKVNAAVPSWWDFYGQALRLLEIFEQIERRELSATDTGAQGRGIA
jgi:15-cis-phytoene synthase